MDYRDNRQRWAESHQVVHFYAGQWCTFTPALTADAKGLPFVAAMALHCFVNEYVFPESAQESAMVEQLQERIAAILKEKREVTPSLIAALGAYRPLHSFPWARDLGEMVWTGCFS